MTMDLAAVVVGAALFGAAAGALVPNVVAVLPEPVPSPVPEPGPEAPPVGPPDERDVGLADQEGTDPAPATSTATAAKVPYVVLARTRGLRAGSAVVTALTCAAIAWRLGWSAPLPAWLFLGVVGVLLAWVDARTCLLPTRVIAPTYVVVGGLLLLASAITGDWQALERSVIGWVVGGGTFVILWVISPRGMGYGDVRLSGVLALALGWLGWAEFGIGMYAGFVLGAVIGGTLALLGVVDRRHYPFGPFMLLGAMVGLVWGAPLVAWYLDAQR